MCIASCRADPTSARITHRSRLSSATNQRDGTSLEWPVCVEANSRGTANRSSCPLGPRPSLHPHGLPRAAAGSLLELVSVLAKSTWALLSRPSEADPASLSVLIPLSRQASPQGAWPFPAWPVACGPWTPWTRRGQVRGPYSHRSRIRTTLSCCRSVHLKAASMIVLLVVRATRRTSPSTRWTARSPDSASGSASSLASGLPIPSPSPLLRKLTQLIGAVSRCRSRSPAFRQVIECLAAKDLFLLFSPRPSPLPRALRLEPQSSSP